MRIFVTGATGLLGLNTVLYLLSKGHQVRALVRNKKKFPDLNHEKLELTEGDIQILPKLKSSMRGCDFVVHCAALTRMDNTPFDDFYQSNVLGTKNIITSCISNKVQRLIYIGSANLFGYGNRLNPGDESVSIYGPMKDSCYARSKLMAQNYIDSASDNLDIISLHPSFMLGSNDLKPSSGKLIKTIMDKKLLFYPPGGKNFVNVKDVVCAIEHFLNHGQLGQSYLICNQNLTYRDFYKLTIKLNEQKSEMIPLKRPLLSAVGYLFEFLSIFKFHSAINRHNMASISIKNFYSNKKAVKAGVSFSPITEGIEDALNWFKNPIYGHIPGND